MKNIPIIPANQLEKKEPQKKYPKEQSFKTNILLKKNILVPLNSLLKTFICLDLFVHDLVGVSTTKLGERKKNEGVCSLLPDIKKANRNYRRRSKGEELEKRKTHTNCFLKRNCPVVVPESICEA